jgi:hypothetical protein
VNPVIFTFIASIGEFERYHGSQTRILRRRFEDRAVSFAADKISVVSTSECALLISSDSPALAVRVFLLD